MTNRSNDLRVLGCDVGKDSITLFDTLSGQTRCLDNTPKALRRALAEVMPDPAGALLVCEATGGHEAALLAAAWRIGLAAHRLDPRKAHNFAQSLRNEGKTDAIDARGLARYGLERGNGLTLWHPPEPCQEQLTDLIRLRSDMVDTRADYRRRHKAPGKGPHKRHIAALIDALTRRIDKLEAEIDRLIAEHDPLRDRVRVISAIPGCGRITAVSVVALMPELGQLNRRQAAALAGLAPHPNDSGKTNRYRRVRGGRREIRTVLFMAALAASRAKSPLAWTYQRLRENGKTKMVALIAIARKLITIINARIRDQIQPQTKLC